MGRWASLASSAAWAGREPSHAVAGAARPAVRLVCRQRSRNLRREVGVMSEGLNMKGGAGQIVTLRRLGCQPAWVVA